MTNKPLISVIVPCYNQSQYLNESLQSVLDQTYTNWECIIVNDGSPDNTEEIAEKWEEKDSRFKYLKKENGGLSSARNAGMEIAKGEWILFLDCDDRINKEKLNNSSFFFDNHDIIITNFELFRDSVKYPPFCNLENVNFNLENIILKWDNGLNIPIHCALFLRKSIDKIIFNTKFKSKEDWEFWIKYYELEKRTHFINKKLADYRINPNSVGLNFELINFANQEIFNNSSEIIKTLMFKRLNDLNMLKDIRNRDLDNQNKKLLNSKFYKLYIKIRSTIKI